MKSRKPPAICPVCSQEVPPNALACPECGADYNSGWREDSYDGVGLPEDFDYEEFTRREFGSRSRPTGIGTGWWVTAMILVVVLLYLVFKLAF
ncbi:MAG: zinc ribbon domain-containing protein [Chthoniobacterales bacterium]